MQILKKWISVFLCLSLLAGILCIGVYAKEAEPLHYFLMGDSVAEGVGVVNRDEASYGAIVAKTNGYDYANVGFAGCTSEDLLYRLQTRSTYRDYVAWADIISVSVGGNDFLLGNAVLLLAQGILFHAYGRFDEIAAQYAKNLEAIMDEIHAINPDAVILLQTLYNSWNSKFASEPYQQVSDRINAAIFALHEKDPESFVIVDTRSAMSFQKDLITTDTIHPNAAGNVVLARLVLETLYGLGLGKTTEPLLETPGIDRDCLIEYFPFPLGHIITFLANWATGNL